MNLIKSSVSYWYSSLLIRFNGGGIQGDDDSNRRVEKY